MNPKLSIIIPVYKVEDYLERCVRSVINQDYRDIEVILVDDGSPDRCPQICDFLAEEDERITVIHKQNGGLSSARNAGIKIAKGDYLLFLDSDDQWAEGRLKPLMTYLEKSPVNMLMFRSVALYPDGSLRQRDERGLFRTEYAEITPTEIYEILIKTGNLHEQAGSHILNTQFTKDNKLYFKEGITGEDIEWFFRVMRVIDHIGVANISLMVYTSQRSGSITNSISKKNVKDMLEIVQESIAFYNADPHFYTKPYELAHCAYLWSIALGYCAILPKEDAKECKATIKKLRRHLHLASHPKSRFVGVFYNLCGFNITMRILKLYMFLHRKNIVNAIKKING